MKEPEKTWEHKGRRCMVVVHPSLGHRCGYVAVTEGEPWHGLDYTDRVPDPKAIPEDAAVDDYGMAGMIAVLAGDLTDRVDRVELQVQVHGGVTFAGRLTEYDPDGLWWFGFDTAHAGDTPARWTLERVMAETERMADQIPNAQAVAK